MKNDEQIVENIRRAQQIVGKAYADDERVKKASSADSGIARETDIVFSEVLRHLLQEE